jgi:site-specific recombinase XerD
LTIAERAIPVVRSARVRRPKGAGSAREIRDGVWQLTVTDASGRRTFRTIAGNRDDAERELARMSAQNGQLPTTLDALIAVHLARLEEAGRSESTLRRYEQLWRTWLSPSLGAQARDSVRAVDIESALNAMHEAGQGQRSIHQAAVVLNTAFAWAKRQNITRANPVLRCELPDGTTLITSRGR